MKRLTTWGVMLVIGLGLGSAFAQQQPAAPPRPPAAQAPAQPPAQAPAQPKAQAPAQTAQPQAAAPGSAAEAARGDIKKTFGFVPRFLNDVPDIALPGAWEEMKGLQMNPNTALPPKVKELIGLAVAAQVPCTYCIYAHTEFAKVGGASDAECKEAVIVGAATRHWSTILQGAQGDLGKFRREIQGALEHTKKIGSGQAPAPKPMPITDANSALVDMQQYFGMVPDFMRRVPPEALPGAWKEMRDVQMNPNTALSGKYKTLIGIAVASQIPCRYCLVADTEFAKMEGASEREINEAVAMAALTRHWSTWLNGSRTDEPQFKRDIDKLTRGARQQAAASSPKGQLAKAGSQPAGATKPATPAKPAP